MKNTVILFFCVVLFISCSNDDDSPNLNNYMKVALNSSTCTGYKENGKITKKTGEVVFLYKEGMNTDLPPIILIRDQDGKEYFACGLPEEYQQANLKIVFSGVTYSPDPTANYIYNAIDLKLTDLWVKK